MMIPEEEQFNQKDKGDLDGALAGQSVQDRPHDAEMWAIPDEVARLIMGLALYNKTTLIKGLEIIYDLVVI